MHFTSKLLNTRNILEHLNLNRGMRVADFGCGRTAHITLPLAAAVGAGGLVYAVDIAKKHLETHKNFCAMQGISHVNHVWGDFEREGGVDIDSKSLDYIFLVNNLGATLAKERLAQEAKRLLNDNGRFVVVDWRRDYAHPVAPPARRRMNLHDASLLFTRLGFVPTNDFPVSPTHWGLELRAA